MIRRRPTPDEIAQRANEIYQQRGRGDADAHKAWLDAAAELEAAEAAAESRDPIPSADATSSDDGSALPAVAGRMTADRDNDHDDDGR